MNIKHKSEQSSTFYLPDGPHGLFLPPRHVHDTLLAASSVYSPVVPFASQLKVGLGRAEGSGESETKAKTGLQSTKFSPMQEVMAIHLLIPTLVYAASGTPAARVLQLHLLGTLSGDSLCLLKEVLRWYCVLLWVQFQIEKAAAVIESFLHACFYYLWLGPSVMLVDVRTDVVRPVSGR